MVISLGPSRTLTHGKLIKFMPLCVYEQIAVNCYGLREDPSRRLYHSIAQTRKASEFGIAREDYTLNQDVAKANWMITELCKVGRISEAREVFEVMPERDVISWTALITGYMKCDLVEEARELFDKIDAKKNVVTWTAVLSGYLRMKRISEAERLFNEMPTKNIVAWNTMINGYVRNGRIDQAVELFERMGERNIASWNIVISGLINCGQIEDAMVLFHKMPARNVISWTILISGLARNGRIDEARLLFDTTPCRNVISWNAMITGYAQNRMLEEAHDLFQAMPERNIHSWNTMICGCIQNGELEGARRLFNEMPRKNVVSWTSMITGCFRCGESEEALQMFVMMRRDGRIRPNEVTLVSILGACSDLAGRSEGMQVHQITAKTVYQESEVVISALVNMYSKCGELELARQIFDDEMYGQRDLVSWNSMIAAYAHHGCGREAIRIFDEMQDMGFRPNDTTYIGLLTACSHAGLLQEGLYYFDLLLKDKSIQVKEDHYTCVVDLYCRAGHLEEALHLIEQLPSTASSAHDLGALLLGCSIHENPHIGKRIADKQLAVDAKNMGVHALLSNMLTINGNWKEAEMVKLKMKNGGVKKQPGSSWIEVHNNFHVFVVGNDRSRRENEALHSLLYNLHDKMKKIGCEEWKNPGAGWVFA